VPPRSHAEVAPGEPSGALTHLRSGGGIAMVDVAGKATTDRSARAEAFVRMSLATETALREATLAKGDAFTTAQIAGIFAAKATASLIPLAHPLPLASVEVTFEWAAAGLLRIVASARTNAPTGVELEAMTAASIAALTIYDMTKSMERGITIESTRLLEKRGGKSGTWRRSP